MGLSQEGQERVISTLVEVSSVQSTALKNFDGANEEWMPLRKRTRVIAAFLPHDPELPNRLHALIANPNLDVAHVKDVLEDRSNEVSMASLRRVVALLCAGLTPQAVSRSTGVSTSAVEKVSRFLATKQMSQEKCEAIAYEYALAEFNFQAWRRRVGRTARTMKSVRRQWGDELLKVHRCLSDEEEAVVAGPVAQSLGKAIGKSRRVTLVYLQRALNDVEQVEGVLA